MPATRTPENHLEQIHEQGWVPSIGQIDAAACRFLDREVRAGRLAKYRGYWDSGHAAFGMGPLKTIYALPAVAENAARLVAHCKQRAEAA
jgi:hypothetical protein